MGVDHKLNVLIVDDNPEHRENIKYALFWILSKNFHHLESITEKNEYMKNRSDEIKFQCTINLKKALNALESTAEFDLITVGWYIGIHWDERGIQVIEHLKENHPELLKKTIAISSDAQYLDDAKKTFQVKTFDKYDRNTKQEELKEYIKDILQLEKTLDKQS